ncbi:MAG: putative O-glycosylation ligase, exosortase A system-associated [Comamonadaceae bacterium CG_4_9_14_3_um_filter_60_33]|nr:MAG: putative O-glycosylation ligase, exosortase A system-associated [Comamonadaceae bacterium CG_4_9_14_3_um_filter_60_33]
MRDTLLIAVLAYFLARSFSRPWIGVLVWTWLSIMNPHQLGYFVRTLPLAATAVAVVLAGLLFSREGRERRSFPVTPETVVLILFVGWMCITTLFAFDPADSYPQWKKIMKIDFMIVVALLILHTRHHIMALAWVVVGSIGFYGFKGGLFTLATGGNYIVWGPPTTYIEGNNELALALVVTIPLIRFLQMNVTAVWLKHSLTLVMVLCAVAAIGSQSRGAFLAISGMGLLLWWRGKSKLVPAVVFVVFAVALLAFMPETWHDRMATIQNYEQDGSAMGRINAWHMTWNLAGSNFFGGGFSIYTPEVFARYAPNPNHFAVAHSIYFSVLGEHGFVGLFLYLLLWILVWRSAGRLRVQGRQQPQTQWLSDLGAMCQVSLVGYAVGGAFLSLAYFDLPYNILILVVLGCRWLDSKAWLTEPVVASPWRSALGLRT